MDSQTPTPSQDDSPGCLPILIGFGGIALSLVLLLFVLLRETPHFWLNSGGYPRWLRFMVYWLYYPLLALYFSAISFYTITLYKTKNSIRPPKKSAGIFCGILWLLFLGIVCIQVWNNLDNWFNNRPLHLH